ncbi:hypothetical protein NDU88_001786 [Pleurodeles waltl]|uniref:Uncharacterized protein n=1 Tax=Pleurodeles waltl TaxID=8319 RepID=A0AAV7LDW6_PLEWA|nr:hypothetical protein NDU88_001786 [Pleurodeles waltl]
MSQSLPRDSVATGQPRVAGLPSGWFLPVPGGGSFVLGRPDPGAEGHSPHPGRPGSAGRSAVAPLSCALPGSSEVALTVRLTSSASASLRSPVRIRRGSPRPSAHPLRASPLSPEPGATEPKSPRTNEAGRVAPLPAGGPRSQPAPGTSCAPHGTRIGGGPVSGRAPIPGLAETPVAQPPSLEIYRSGRGQRSRLGLCRHRYRRSLRGPGARRNG